MADWHDKKDRRFYVKLNPHFFPFLFYCIWIFKLFKNDKDFLPYFEYFTLFYSYESIKEKKSKEWIQCHHAFGLHIIDPVNQKRLPSIITVTCDSEPKNAQDGKISDITILKLGEIVNSHIQLSYLKGLTPSWRNSLNHTIKDTVFRKKNMSAP